MMLARKYLTISRIGAIPPTPVRPPKSLSPSKASSAGRLILCGGAADGIGCSLIGADLGMNRSLETLHAEDRSGGLGGSAPQVARWLGISAATSRPRWCKCCNKDALDRYGLQRMLLEPEMLAAVEPDTHLVATLLALKGLMAAKVQETARQDILCLAQSGRGRYGGVRQHSGSGHGLDQISAHLAGGV